MYNSTRAHPVLPPFGVFKVSEGSTAPSNQYMVQSVETHHTSVFHPGAVGMGISLASQQPLQQVNNGGYEYPPLRLPLHPQRTGPEVREREVYERGDRRALFQDDENEVVYQAARILISLSSS
ncbi:hypothetical protein K7432_010389 [Basidiobolus ranarum]|uniref:Uncharacterized protein n=1 Tax=Basidiobolus ranarum TaxID=34480 RepID=A0ABR2VVJ5_9FUNG